ncbi:hypothetical protein [Pseudonocardia sp. GCM10023141]|uniref:hypothetical protein n=1 Tax=Pseudonocardia sp. GCM10023141 TaxID=3252653 RepID=UPI0036084569
MLTSAPRAADRAPESSADLASVIGDGMPQDLELRRLAAELAPMVDVWQRLLTLHQPDRNGRCRMCTKGGTGLPSSPWPCSIHGIAELARRRHDSVCERPEQAS